MIMKCQQFITFEPEDPAKWNGFHMIMIASLLFLFPFNTNVPSAILLILKKFIIFENSKRRMDWNNLESWLIEPNHFHPSFESFKKALFLYLFRKNNVCSFNFYLIISIWLMSTVTHCSITKRRYKNRNNSLKSFDCVSLSRNLLVSRRGLQPSASWRH